MEFHELGIQPYTQVWEQMKAFTQSRTRETADQCWFVEHFPVYTQGIAGKPAHLIQLSDIPLVQSDRGGQVTYHGPGQLVIYPLVDLHRLSIGIKSFIAKLEDCIIQLLASYQIEGQRQCKAPGVYVEGEKIASLGLRVKNGCTYHGISLNVAMDLRPFQGINPCGFSGLSMTQMAHFVPDITVQKLMQPLQAILSEELQICPSPART